MAWRKSRLWLFLDGRTWIEFAEMEGLARKRYQQHGWAYESAHREEQVLKV